jgi:hypothetical protein
MAHNHNNRNGEGQISLEDQVRQWGRVPDALKQSALSRTKLYQLIETGKIVSVSLREPGQKKATRLICLRSLNDYIESFIPKSQVDGGTVA